MTPESQDKADALPTFERDGKTWTPLRARGEPGDLMPTQEDADLTDLAAILSQLDPATRAKVLEPYLPSAEALRMKRHHGSIEVDAARQVFHIPTEGLATVAAACLTALDEDQRAQVMRAHVQSHMEPTFEATRKLRAQRDGLEAELTSARAKLEAVLRAAAYLLESGATDHAWQELTTAVETALEKP